MWRTLPEPLSQVPSLVVKTMILLLPLRYTPDGQPSTFLRRYSFREPDVLAAKLAINRDVVIDAAVCCDLKRKELKTSYRRFRNSTSSLSTGHKSMSSLNMGRLMLRIGRSAGPGFDSLLPPELETMRSRCIVRAKYAIYMCVPKWLIG